MKKFYIFETPTGSVESMQDRPPTNLGSQGDHVSAYAIIKYSAKFYFDYVEDEGPLAAEEIVMRKFVIMLEALQTNLTMLLDLIASEQAIDKVCKDVKAIGEVAALVVEQFASLEKVEGYTTSAMFEELEKRFGDNAKLLSHFRELAEKENKSIARSILIRAANEYLCIRNAMLGVAYSREGSESPPEEEATSVKTAMKTLCMSELICQRAFDKKVDPTFTESDFLKIHNSVFNLFWYPRISKVKIITFNTDEELREWQKRKGYKKEAFPRDNEIPNLFRQMCSHITLIFSCFPSLSQSPRTIEIMNAFKNKVINQWELSENEQGELESLFKDNLPQNIRDEIYSAQTSSASGSGHSSDAGEGDSRDKGTLPRPPRLRASMFAAPSATADSDGSESSYTDGEAPAENP